MTDYKQVPNLIIFKNDKAGQQVIRNGQPVEYNGKPIIESDLNGKITLPEGLNAGEYEVKIYKKVSKAGKSYYSGTIKPAYVKKDKAIDQHNQAKSNGYQPQEEEMDDSIPW